MFEADIAFFAKRHDPDTRKWLFEDFHAWFHNPGDSRAYVLLGDPGVGKSVVAGALTQRMREAGQLGAAYFCRHNDGTRNDPRYLLGTVARQLCDCNTQYKAIVGGEDGVKMLLANSKLGVRELFTKLLHEPLSKCLPCQQRLLVIIDALDETEYESRDDFLDLIMHRFPLLPKWLVFFITSRPEESVLFRLKKYNPCVKICAGNSDQKKVYRQHEQDIQTFLKKRIDFSGLPYSVDDVSKTCNGLFLYAHYIVKELRDLEKSGKNLNQLSDLFPGNIDDFFHQNFMRVYDQVGQNIFKKLFGCAIVAPSPLPVSIISYILKKENSNHDEQHVIDAVSQFVVLRTSDQTLTFLHNLVPAWLTDKTKASRKLFIDKKMAREYLRDVFVEILSLIAHEPSSACTSIDEDLEDYVVRIAVCFLCQLGGKESLKLVFFCLTNYNFMERRLLSGKVEIYHLLEDLNLAGGRLGVDDKQKQDILQEVSAVIKSNVLVLSVCPTLLRSAIQSSSKVVQETIIIPEFSDPWLECNFRCFPDINIAGMHCFATSSDKKTVAGARDRTLLLFNASSAQTVGGPFTIYYTESINHLEFSTDDKFIFFGRLDKWFSVERKCVEDFPQFSKNCDIYDWGVFTLDGQSIVVKGNRLKSPCTCHGSVCFMSLLALWALKEIEQSRDDEMTVRLCYDLSFPERLTKRLLQRLGIKTNSDHTREIEFVYDSECHCCYKLISLTQSDQEPSLNAVRQCIIELYSHIFQYQVWDLQTGMPVLQHIFEQKTRLDAVTYMYHVAYAFSDEMLEMECSGVGEARSVCNIATVSAISLMGELGLWLNWEKKLKVKLDEKPVLVYKLVRQYLCLELTEDFSMFGEMEPTLTPREGVVERKLRRGLEWNLERVRELERRLSRERYLAKNLSLREPLEELKEWLLCVQQTLEPFPLMHRSPLIERQWKISVSPQLLKAFQNEAFTFEVCSSIPKGFQSLVKDKGDIYLCVSPERKWVIEADGLPKVRILRRENQNLPCSSGKPEHIITKVERFTFTNDDLYFVYQTDEGSLHALSLQTGTDLTSVPDRNLRYFTKESQAGYLFRSDTEERAIFLSSLFCPFTFIPGSRLGPRPGEEGKSIAAAFCSIESILTVSSDSGVTLWQVTEERNDIIFQSYSIIMKSGLRIPYVKDCVVSPDGKLIAIHQGISVELYNLTGANCVELLYTIFEAECENTVAYMTFSSDSISFLVCIHDFKNPPQYFVWDVQGKCMSAIFKSQTLLVIECCCLSSCREELILCGEYQIEIWKYDASPCRLLTRLGVEKAYQSVTFSRCGVSLDDQFLVCCIANRIIVYSLHASHINSSKRVLRGHLGRIDFCQFLRVNRYLISYGIDGMVFLWDMSEFKAVGFAKIAQGKESIMSMAVSPKEDTAVCFTSSGRVCVIRLRELGFSLPLNPLSSSLEGKEKAVHTSLQLADEIASTCQEPASFTGDDDMVEAMSISDSEEDMYYYYLEHEILDDSD